MTKTANTTPTKDTNDNRVRSGVRAGSSGGGSRGLKTRTGVRAGSSRGGSKGL
jgi:hypothetical protein